MDLAPVLLTGPPPKAKSHRLRAGKKQTPGTTRFNSRHLPRPELPIRSVITTPVRRGYFRASLEQGGASS
jgi:hypothetical protein